MYRVSSHRHRCAAEELDTWEQQHAVKLPLAYRQFLLEYGQGTYNDLFHVEMPDPERLQEFAEYGLWEHGHNSPITASQLTECVVIASTVDGDMLALHREVTGGFWLPRHSEQIVAVAWQDLVWEDFMKQQLKRLYGEMYPSALHESYFEPWNGRQQHEFLMLHAEDVLDQDWAVNGFINTLEGKQSYLRAVAAQLANQYEPDLNMQTVHTGKLFYRALEGYIRFNYAYGNEVALFYESSQSTDGGVAFVEHIRRQLHAAGIK
ncbi:SMI1/KNR4 family protein [Paenibacillus wenxiniae]|uniref:SMI1/KNR4 family protein n=1 Tax=Paenibacillus wenxiniae TaxID=1636843 RepID=A0ABW4RKI8_9BACL